MIVSLVQNVRAGEQRLTGREGWKGERQRMRFNGENEQEQTGSKVGKHALGPSVGCW